jgi:amidohydrolase
MALNKEELKRKACEAIERRKSELVAVAKKVLENPETGFHEFKTSRLVAEEFEKLGIPHRNGLALTGVKGWIEGGAGPGPRVSIIGELDSLLVPEHSTSDPTTGAAHACGHHCQIGMMLGTLVGLQTPEVLSQLSGRIVPFAVPAEEFVQVEKRMALRDEKKIEFLSGKQELIKLGEFDDVDMAIMCHTASDLGRKSFAVGGTSNAHVVKYIQFLGKGAHAGGSPHLGINALNAAAWSLMAIHANREGFPESETVRIHGIINRGGESVSAVPSDIRLEWRVRSGSPEAVAKNSERVDRCFKAGAMAVGGRVKITNIPGYMPLKHDSTLQRLFKENAEQVVGHEGVLQMPSTRNRGGSTDMGDLSQIMPACHPYTGGATGAGHSKEYTIKDYESAVINPAKIMAMVAIDLLSDGAAGAKEALSGWRASMTKEQYLSFQRERAREVEFDGGRE